MTPPMDRDRLAAFVDGALSPEEAAEVVMHLADHPADQAHVDDLIAANELLAAAYDGPLHEPVPEAIRAAIMGGDGAAPARHASPLPTALPFRPRRSAAVWMGGALALAASVAAVAVVMQGSQDPAAGRLLAVGPVAAGSELARVIDGLPSLAPERLAGGQEVMILGTLRTADGRYCREVEVIDEPAARLDQAIACTTSSDGWSIEIAVQEALHASDGDGFAAASGTGAGTLGQFLDRLGAGQVMDPEAEARAISGGWTR